MINCNVIWRTFAEEKPKRFSDVTIYDSLAGNFMQIKYRSIAMIHRDDLDNFKWTYTEEIRPT